MKNSAESKNADIFVKRKGVLFQISLLQGLTNGDYYGSVSIGELKQHGDTGIGTFNKLNGELIMLDGEVYRASGNGSIEYITDEETTPFAVTAFLEADESAELKEIPDIDTLFNELNKIVEKRSKNRFYMIRIDGSFSAINVRSVHKQKEPYKRLIDVLAIDQTLFNYENIEGAMVGLYCPFYMSSLNAAGWHLHFISKDKTKGGHVLDAHISEAVLTLKDIDTFEVRLPKNEIFSELDLTIDQSEDIEKVERNKK